MKKKKTKLQSTDKTNTYFNSSFKLLNQKRSNKILYASCSYSAAPIRKIFHIILWPTNDSTACN